LSFPLNKPTEIRKGIHLGDVIISLDTAKRQAKTGRIPLREECTYLILHGILHLIGHDHIKESDYVRMSRSEEKIWKIISKIPFEKMQFQRY